MGTYLNPGRAAYEESVNSEIFIDKSEMISYLNTIVKTKQKYVSVSRPRRFGKTMAAEMICAYYDREADSRELFKQSKLYNTETIRKGKKEISWDSYLGVFDVIYITMTDFINADRGVDEGLKLITRRVLNDLGEEYPDVKYDPSDLFYSMDRFYRHSRRAFVIIIDEWDTVFREHKEDTEGQTRWVETFKSFETSQELLKASISLHIHL